MGSGESLCGSWDFGWEMKGAGVKEGPNFKEVQEEEEFQSSLGDWETWAQIVPTYCCELPFLPRPRS